MWERSISIVERSALRATYTPEEYHDVKKRELKEYIKANAESGKEQEELIGDYYLTKKDARRAAAHFYKAAQASGQTTSLLKKIVAAEYNTAMQYIRERHFTHALHHLEKARKAYLEALKSTSPKIHSFAQYKLAWCDYNAGDYQGAITRFKDVIDYTEKMTQKGDKNALKGEALNDIVLSFVQIEATDEAIQYFESKTNKKRSHKLTQKLADVMAGSGKHDSAIKVYRRLIEGGPLEPAPGSSLLPRKCLASVRCGRLEGRRRSAG